MSTNDDNNNDNNESSDNITTTTTTTTRVGGPPYTTKEILFLTTNIVGSGIMITCAIALSCDSTPSINYYCLACGVINAVHEIIKFGWHIPFDPDHHYERHHLPTVVYDATIPFLFGVAIWGAVITFPYLLPNDDETYDCDEVLYGVGFGSSMLLIVFFGFSCDYFWAMLMARMARDGDAPEEWKDSVATRPLLLSDTDENTLEDTVEEGGGSSGTSQRQREEKKNPVRLCTNDKSSSSSSSSSRRDEQRTELGPAEPNSRGLLLTDADNTTPFDTSTTTKESAD